MYYTYVIEADDTRKAETMTTTRLNAKVAKMEVGKPVKWSETGLGTLALDNAIAADHVVLVEMPADPDEHYIMRPAAGQLGGMLKFETQFGKTVYMFAVDQTPELPRPQADAETIVTAQP